MCVFFVKRALAMVLLIDEARIVNGLYWIVWVFYVKRAVNMVLLVQLECEWIELDIMGVVCEACSLHGVSD